MKKTSIASAIALTLGTAGSAHALSISITSADLTPPGTIYTASGTLTDSGTFGSMSSIDTFLYAHWTANAVTFFDTYSTTLAWAGTSAQGSYSYTFHLTGHQVAWGTKFDWSGNTDIPILVMMDCAPGTTGSTCTGFGPPLQTIPFPMSTFSFNGTIATGSVPFSGGAVPVPAAAWLFGSGLVGLGGIAARRRKKH